jgi:hypothetical protein
MEKICVNKLTFSFFKVRQPANQRPSSSWGLFDKTNLQVVPKNGPIICASKLQVHGYHLQVSFYKLILQLNLQAQLQVFI